MDIVLAAAAPQGTISAPSLGFAAVVFCFMVAFAWWSPAKWYEVLLVAVGGAIVFSAGVLPILLYLFNQGQTALSGLA